MNAFKWILLLALVPATVQAASYEYECEPDADGIEGLCIAEPTDLPTKKKASNIAESEAASKPLLFGADNSGKEKPAPGVPANMQKPNNAALSAIRAQDKIRQVETFLQPIKGADGFAGDNTGPAKAGQ